MSPTIEPDDDLPERFKELPDPTADDQFVDDFNSDWFFDYTTKKQDLIGQLWATEREPVASAWHTPVIPRVLGGSAVVLAIVAVAVISSMGNVRRHIAPLPTTGAVTMIFVPPGSVLWSSTFLKQRAGQADHPHRIGRQPTAVAAAVTVPHVTVRLAEAHPSSAGAATRRPLPRTQPQESPKTLAVPPPVAYASQTSGSARVASSTPTRVNRPAPLVDNPHDWTKPVPGFAAAGRSSLPPQPEAGPLAQSASAGVLDSLPSGGTIHLEIFYGSHNVTAARSVAALLRSDVVGIGSLNIRSGDTRPSVIAYFFPSDRAGARAIAASLHQIANESLPVELLRRVPQPRPGTVEIFVPSLDAKTPSDSG